MTDTPEDMALSEDLMKAQQWDLGSSWPEFFWTVVNTGITITHFMNTNPLVEVMPPEIEGKAREFMVFEEMGGDAPARNAPPNPYHP